MNARPAALPVPIRQDVQAFALPSVVDRWGEVASGIRAIEKGDNVVTMFGMIGDDFWEEGITAKTVSRSLRAISGDVVIHLNSPGGDVFEGFAIYNALREHPYNVTVKIMGMAASAASVIAMAADKIEIGVAAFVMVHNCWVTGIGNRHDLRELADFLEPYDAALNSVYQMRTGQSAADVTKWLDDETYMSGQQAIERGFADALLPADAMKVDEKAKAEDKKLNDIRSLELSLVSSGMTRAQARERIQRIKGKPGAVSDSLEDGDTPGAVTYSAADWVKAAAESGIFAALPTI